MANMADRFFAINTEATYGATIVSALKYGEIDDESFSPQFEIMTRSDVSRYGARATTIGMETSAGSISWAMLGDEFTGKLLANAFGKSTTTGSSAPYTHTLEEAASDVKAALASGSYTGWNSLTCVIGREGRSHRFPGQVLNSLTIGANINEYVMCSADFVGCGEDNTAEHADAAPGDADFHTADAFHFEGAHVAFEGLASVANERTKLVKSIELTINLNRDTDSAVALGNNTYTRFPVAGMREITGTIEFNRVIHDAGTLADVTNEPFYKELASGLLVNGTTSDPAISLYFTGGTNESLQIDLFKVQYDAPDSTISGRDRQTMSVSFTALYDEGVGAMSKAVWKSTKSAAPLA